MVVFYGLYGFEFEVLKEAFSRLQGQYFAGLEEPELLDNKYAIECKLLIADLTACEDLSLELRIKRNIMIKELVGFVSACIGRHEEAFEIFNLYRGL